MKQLLLAWLALLPFTLWADDALQAQWQQLALPAHQLQLNQTTVDNPLQQEGWLLVNFWSAFCGPCRIEMPSLELLQLQQPQLQVVTVSLDVKRLDLGRRLMADMAPSLLAYEQGQELAKLLQVEVIPTTLLIAPNGQIHARIVGERKWQDEALQQQLLQHLQQVAAITP